MRLGRGVKRLLSMTGVQSFATSLSDEANWLRRQFEADHSTIYGGAGGSTSVTAPGDAAMRDMIAGDVTNNYPLAPKKGAGLLTTALLAGATGVGGAILWDKLDEPATTTPAVEQPDQQFTDTDTIMDVVFPE